MRWIPNFTSKLMIAIAAFGVPGHAFANIALSQVIVDLKPGDTPTQDIEVWNNSADRSYVVAEPAEVISPGAGDEHRTTNPDPAQLGILVTPQRMILEPGQKRLIRVSAVVARGSRDRIYRVAVKPVAGDITASVTALKLLIGYDVLVIYRPEVMSGNVTAQRSASAITFTNTGNTNVEMFEGRQCDAAGANCKTLPATRLYAGASWQVPIDGPQPVQYRVATANQSVVKTY